MIPSSSAAKLLWDKYNLPPQKRLHSELVAKVAVVLANQLKTKNLELRTDLLMAAALLHDIDKNVPQRPGERHPDMAVRILEEEGMGEVAKLVKTHPLHAILDPAISPQTWEEKILYLADKMVKYEIISVDERFNLWRAEIRQLADAATEREILEKTYPLVKELEAEILGMINLTPADIRELAQKE